MTTLLSSIPISMVWTYYAMHKKIVAAILTVSVLGLTACGSPHGPRYKEARSYSEGVAPVQANNGRWGYIDTRNQWIIPAEFEDAKEFRDGRAAVKANGKWGFINKRGDWQ
jgi:hypothetical protein